MRRRPIRPAPPLITRVQFDTMVEAFRQGGFLRSGPCLPCLIVQRRQRRDERL